MNKSERQAVFTKVYRHLLEQGVCTYRDLPKYHYRGKSCAIGCLIPVEKYDKGIENLGISDDKVWKFLEGVMPNLSEDDYSFMSRLQGSHDCGYVYAGKDGWLKEMRFIAKDYHLLMPK
jgi:hypothetical protein